jgi:hypothetical protein
MLTCAILLAWCGAAQSEEPLPVSLQDQEPDPELRRAIREKQDRLNELRKETQEEGEKLKSEIKELYGKLYGPLPSTLWTAVRVPYGIWHHRLSLDDGPGIEMNFAVGSQATYEENGGFQRTLFTPVPAPPGGTLGFGIRYFSAHDERTGGRADVITYEIVRWQQDHTWDGGFGLGGSFVFGLTRITNRGAGGDHDTALDYSIELPHATYAPSRTFRAGLGMTWGLLQTSLNQNHTHGVYYLSPSISLELFF